MRASVCNQLTNELIQQLHQHCLIFPHPPRKNLFAIWQFQDAKNGEKSSLRGCYDAAVSIKRLMPY